MRTKHTVILIILVLACGFTSTPGSGTGGKNPAAIFESEIITDGSGANLKCSLQTKKSTLRHSGDGSLRISVNSNWVCQ